MSNQLEQLQPLIYPTQTTAHDNWWLWLISAVLLSLITLALYLWRRRRNQQRQQQRHAQQLDLLRQQAIQELEQIHRPTAGQHVGPWLQQLNQLLKRLCSARFPEHHSHRLSGRLWLAFLDSRCPSAGLTRWMVLVEGSYLPSCQMTEDAVQGLHNSVRLWIEKHA